MLRQRAEQAGARACEECPRAWDQGIFALLAAGAYKTIEEAQDAVCFCRCGPLNRTLQAAQTYD